MAAIGNMDEFMKYKVALSLENASLNQSGTGEAMGGGIGAGMGLGMGLLLWALRDGPVGSVGVLSGLSPVLILPMLWWTFRSAPAPGAWIGAAVAVLGTAMVVAR